jgi:hypothetical protein
MCESDVTRSTSSNDQVDILERVRSWYDRRLSAAVSGTSVTNSKCGCRGISGEGHVGARWPSSAPGRTAQLPHRRLVRCAQAGAT